MASLLCFFGLHNPEIVRITSWGNCRRAELKCRCGKRYEALVAGKFERMWASPFPSEFWIAHDTGDLPELDSNGRLLAQR